MRAGKQFLCVGGPRDGSVESIPDDRNSIYFSDQSIANVSASWPASFDTMTLVRKETHYTRRAVRSLDQVFEVFAEAHLSDADVIRLLIDHYRPPR